ncbi:MAG: NUDIX domain-containing protein [Candidatus Aenigmarchaeota archaeon]|nr:NUDIX domain-containing protein [Candidatus Aenigmarchaeota archaeon]
MQPLKYAVSIILYNDKKQFLVVKRPEEERDLGGIWGFPAVSFDPSMESFDGAVARVGREKLNCEVEPVGRLPITIIQERDGYDLLLIDYKCRVVKGEPDVRKARTSATKYADQKWTSDPGILMEGAEKGSCCIQLFLHDIGLWPREKFRTSLK